MNIRRLAVVAALLSFAPPPAAAQTRPVPIVSVVGEASVDVTPDVAIVSAGVTSQGKTAREASDANGRVMEPVIAALRVGGFHESDIQTARISIQPLHDPNRSTAGRIVAFQASNQVTVKVRDVTKVSDVIDRLLGAGANTLSGVEFLVTDPSMAMDQARAQAIADAERKAKIYAKAIGAQLGRPVSIGEEAQSPRFLRSAAAMATATTPVAIGEETLRVSVTVTYELQY
jgi:uncharacterized protein YggE